MGKKNFGWQFHTASSLLVSLSLFLDLCLYSVRFATTSVSKPIGGMDYRWLWDVSSWAEPGQGAAVSSVASGLKLWPTSLLPCVLVQTWSPTSKVPEELVTLTCAPAWPEFQGGDQALLLSPVGILSLNPSS